MTSVCSRWVVPIFNIVRRELWTHARIQVHLEKTQIWNQGGEKPPGCDALTTDARRHDPNAVVWKGDRALPLDQQGLIVLGTPLGSVEFVQRELAAGSLRCRIFRALGCCSFFVLGQTTFSACCTQRPPGCSLRSMTVL